MRKSKRVVPTTLGNTEDSINLDDSSMNLKKEFSALKPHYGRNESGRELGQEFGGDSRFGERIVTETASRISPQLRRGKSRMFQPTKRSRSTIPIVLLRRQETKREALKYLRTMDDAHITYKKNPNRYARPVNDSRKRYHFSHMCSLLLSFISTGIFIVEHEIYLSYGREAHKSERFLLLCLAWSVNILLCLNIWLSYTLYVDLLKNEWVMYTLDSLSSSGLLKSMLIEVLINLICPYPFFWETYYSDFYQGGFNKVKIYANTPFLCAAIFIRL
ncbi:unnamed protein product [Moneuplotes crassus]|uniref:Uncharacterized protein n=2 Tax=Euplotes crassus TaxID=5936 RepID=A0AAD2D8C9_EUPCR|nr:unnamed protein product [Moneuplotes crassus]